MKIKINNSSSSNNSRLSKTYKVDLTLNKQNASNNDYCFKINDTIMHKEEKIIGTVKFVGSDELSVIWNDGSRERINFSNLNKFSYVDNVEELVAPLNNQDNLSDSNIETRNVNVLVNQPKAMPKVQDTLDSLYEQAFDEMEDKYDDIEDGNPNKQQQSLQRKVNQLEKQISDSKINNIKDKAVVEILDVMKVKGMITDDVSEKLQREAILKMDDVAFESYKTAILAMKPRPDVKLTEAEIMLQKIKTGGPIIGSFDNQHSAKNEITTDTTKGLSSIKQEQPKLNFDGFKGLTGLTKPLQVESKQISSRDKMVSELSKLDWSLIAKQ